MSHQTQVRSLALVCLAKYIHKLNPHAQNDEFWAKQKEHYSVYTIWMLQNGYTDDLYFLRQYILKELDFHQIIIDIRFLAGMIELRDEEIQTYINEDTLRAKILLNKRFARDIMNHLGRKKSKVYKTRKSQTTK